jgi:hypothetical protein
MILPTTQQAYQKIRPKGSPSECVHICTDAPVPVPTKDDVLIKVIHVFLVYVLLLA